MVHIYTMKKRINCFYLYFSNATLLMFLLVFAPLFTLIKRASDCENYDIKMKYIITFYHYKNI